MTGLTVLGSTGSVGVSTLDVVSRNPGSYRVVALTALQAYNQPDIAAHVIAMHNALPKDVKPVAQTLLASRKAWSRDLLTAIDQGRRFAL